MIWRWIKWFFKGTPWYGNRIWFDNQRELIGPNMTREESEEKERRKG